jgi:hypothetical protein
MITPMGFSRAGWALVAGFLLTPLAAQAPVTVAPRYAPGERLTYAIAIHSTLSSGATLDTSAEAELRVQSAAGPGAFTVAARFTRYTTRIRAQSPDNLAALRKQSAATDHAALSMAPAEFAVTPAAFKTVSRQPGGVYDQPVEMLEEIVRTDSLPSGPTAVGAAWTRTRSRSIPTLNVSVPLRLDCSLTAVAPYAGQPAATIVTRAQGQVALPPGSLPGSKELAAQGLVTEATVRFDTTATSHYRLADGVLLESSSSSHNHLHISLVGPSPAAKTTEADVHSTSTVKLEKETPAAN